MTIETVVSPFEAAAAAGGLESETSHNALHVQDVLERRERALNHHSVLTDVRAERLGQFRWWEAPRIRAAIGLVGEVGCPIPGHDGVGNLDEDSDGAIIYRCSCLGKQVFELKTHGPNRFGEWASSLPWTALPDVYRAVWAGEPLRRMAKAERHSWRLLLAYEVGNIEPAAVELPCLPDGATDLMAAVREFAALMFGLRVAVGSDLEMPLPVTFVREYLKLPPNKKPMVGRAIRALCEAGVLLHTNPTLRKSNRPVYLYLPGVPVD